jgi:hypothetical protein
LPATHADLTGLSEHPWNEIVVDGRGNAYLNNTGFDFPEAEFAPGIIALVRRTDRLGRWPTASPSPTAWS